jgi:hypothetical protein
MTRPHRVWTRLQQAWPVTIGVHVFQCLFAATFALPFVTKVPVPSVAVQPQTAEWISLFKLVEAVDHTTVLRSALPLALAALNYPWLSVAWLRALSGEAPFTEHARFALARYRSALGLAASVAVGLGMIAGVTALAMYGIRVSFRATLDARALDLARLACVVPAIFAAVTLVTLQDAGYAAVSAEARNGREIARAMWHRASARLVCGRAALLFGQVVLSLAAWAIPRIALGPSTASDFVVLVTTQAAAFTITCGRAFWLAVVLEPRGHR